MRILVIDDYVEAELAIAHSLRDTAHVVVGARDPRQLPGLLASEDPFGLAIIDMIFGDSPSTGLGALRITRELSPRTATVIRCADEDNRLLHLLAAFLFFSPLALVSKGGGPEQIRALVAAVDRGGAIPSDGDRYRHRGPPPAPLDALLRNKTDLTLWRELTRFDKRPDIARASFVSASTVDHFIADMYPVVEDLHGRYGDSDPQAAVAGRGERAHNTPLIRLAHFARMYQGFFRDPDLDQLLAERWATRRRTVSVPSELVRKDRSRPRRRSGGSA